MKKIKVESTSHVLSVGPVVVQDLVINVDWTVRSTHNYALVNMHTRTAMMRTAEATLQDWRSQRIIDMYSVICDSSNNTPRMESRGEWIMDIVVCIQYVYYRILLTESNTTYQEIH